MTLNLFKFQAPEQARSFTSGSNKSLENERFLVPNIVEVGVDDDEPMAKRWSVPYFILM